MEDSYFPFWFGVYITSIWYDSFCVSHKVEKEKSKTRNDQFCLVFCLVMFHSPSSKFSCLSVHTSIENDESACMKSCLFEFLINLPLNLLFFFLYLSWIQISDFVFRFSFRCSWCVFPHVLNRKGFMLLPHQIHLTNYWGTK